MHWLCTPDASASRWLPERPDVEGYFDTSAVTARPFHSHGWSYKRGRETTFPHRPVLLFHLGRTTTLASLFHLAAKIHRNPGCCVSGRCPPCAHHRTVSRSGYRCHFLCAGACRAPSPTLLFKINVSRRLPLLTLGVGTIDIKRVYQKGGEPPTIARNHFAVSGR